MGTHTCRGCGQHWPENYCPVCHATIDRSLLETPPRPEPPGPVAASVAPSPGAQPPARGLAPPARPGASQVLPVEFTGEPGEYFRIWIVNTALTLVTLGVYAAWAKVAKRRWFWAHTRVAGQSFEYTGDPLAILKGNLVFAAAAVAYWLASRAHPLLAVLPALALGALYPWLFQRAMRFNAWHTRHRNIRFAFRGGLGEGYAVHFGLPLLLPFTLGLLWPYIEWRRRRYQLGQLAWGTARLRFDAAVGPFYRTFFGAILVGLACLACTLPVAAALAMAGPEARPMVLAVTVLGIYVGAGVAGLFYVARLANHVLGHVRVEGVAALRASLRARELIELEALNLLAIVASLGLATPWAAVRRARYRWSRIDVLVEGDFARVATTVAPEPGALGEVAADQFDVDIAF